MDFRFIMKLGIFLVAVFSVMLIPASVAQTLHSSPANLPNPSPIHQLFVDDQSEGPRNITEEEHNRRGDARRAQVRAMLAKGEVQTAQDFHDASFLFQHGEAADDYLLAHLLAVEAVMRSDESSKWLVAATLDRYLQIIGRPQIFGTQYPDDPKKPTGQAEPTKHPYAGRTQEPFDRLLLPSSLRLDFCVPDLSQQKENLQALNKDEYPGRTMVAPGCKR